MAIKSNIKKVDKNFILMNGDTFVDLNFKQYQYFFERNSLKCLSFFLEKKLSKEDKKRYYFKSFNKKNSVNSGIFFINKDLLKLIPVSNKNFDEEIIKLIKKRNDTCKILNLSNIKFIDIGIKKDFSFFKKNLDYFLKKKALFLDRDGVINQDLKYVHKTKDFFWRKDIFSFLKKVISKNYYIFVITNQSGIGRSYYSEKDFFKLNKWILNMLSSKGLHIDDIAWSPYYKFSKKYNSSKFYKLRKPNSGMIDYLKKKWMIDMKNSVFLGDSKVDEMLAKKTDLRFVKVNNNTKLKNITI